MPKIHADDPKTIRNKAIYDAEWTFAQTVIKARDEHRKVLSDPNASNEDKMKATAVKNKTIENAKILKEKTIADAWTVYNTATTTKLNENATQTKKFCFLWWCW